MSRRYLFGIFCRMSQIKEQKFVIRTRYNSQFKFIVLQNISLDEYLEKCKRVFRANWDLPKVKLMDNLRVTIHPNEFDLVIESFCHSGSFFVDINIAGDEDVGVITSKTIEKHISDSNGSPILLDYDQIGSLTLTHRRKMIRLVAEFMIARFGNKISIDDKITVAKAVVELFPSLAVKGKNLKPYHLVYNTPNGGYLGQALKNLVAARAKLGNASRNPVPADFTASDMDTCEAAMNFLKSAVVNSENLAQIKQKMIETMAHRVQLMRDPKLDIKESFPFLFASIELPLFDFCNRFPRARHNALVENWMSIVPVLQARLQVHHKIKLITDWCTEIHEILILLRLMPVKTVGRTLGTIASFEGSVDKLFVFREEGTALNGLVKKGAKYPYIIAVGLDESTISKYYIEFEKHLFDMPEGFSAIQTFDVFFKLHSILNISYEPCLETMMNFLAYFVYDFDNNVSSHENGKKKKKKFVPTNRMTELFDQFPALEN